ncbi:MAG TPA: gamma-glutamyltransferase [Verrucomicrobiota bacterium]|nr:gamma-glutamyltransferase [Verrucomicrobiota bacterium]
MISTAGVAGSEATHGMVATAHPLATDAGVRVLREGGNAVDAAVAAALTLGVVDTDNSGIGGGCFMLIHRADGSLVAIDGRETAPMAATADMFIRNGKADTTLSQSGSLASGVPGALAAYEFAVMNHGTRKLADLLLPAADIAEKGFRLNARYARSLKHVAKDLARFESSRAVFFRNGQLLAEGDILEQPDLAATYRGIAAGGSGWFYRGPFAHAVQRWMKDNGGIITAEDFRNYQVCLRQPLISRYREFRVVGFPPPSSGGIHVAQMLNLLETFNLKSLDEATRLHVIAEAMKLAFADRAYWLGDPDFVNVPRGLMDRNYATTLSRLINPERAAQVTSHGTPPDWETDVFRKHTTHFSVADAAGTWVACTATINTSFGSKVVIPGTGVVMNNQMDDFSIHPGVRNYFGLVGGHANAIAPGKRPLSSMTPTLVLKDQKPIIALGAAGGPKIISQVLLELVSLLDLQMSPKQALAQPRMHHQWSPDELTVEKTLPRKLQAELARRGHKLKQLPSIGVSQIVARSRDGKGFVGAADPRAGGKAAGW